MFKQLDDTMFVSPQIDEEGLRQAAMQGISTIINNRPDGEDADQPTSDSLKAEAEALGLHYKYIPVTHAGFSTLQIDEMVAALSQAHGPVLGFCRTGTRSTLLWSLAQAKLGASPDALEAKAAAAGYNIAPVRAMLDMLAARK